jgi:hypothetical protein
VNCVSLGPGRTNQYAIESFRTCHTEILPCGKEAWSVMLHVGG